MAEPDVKILRDQFAFDQAEWKSIRDEGIEDMQYVAGDPWEPGERQTREKEGRLCLSADELSQYTNQVVNDVRANKRAVKFSPVGNGANDKSAQFYADKWREIEYRSRAQIAYTTAFQNCVERSFGFVRVNMRPAHAKSVNLDLWVDAVPNPNLITPDPFAVMPDLSDMKRCWVREQWTTDDFDQKWSDAAVGPRQAELMKVAGDWITTKGVFVGEHWCIYDKKRTLLVVQVDGQSEPIGLFADDLKGKPLPGTLLEERSVTDQVVKQQLTNGIEILEETDWPGRYIPIVSCFGKVIYVEETGSQKKQILSMVRLARDPQMLYAYLTTCEAELVAMTPKFPYFVYEGQLRSTELTNLQNSLHQPIAVVQVKAMIDGAPAQTVLPFPQRQPYEPPLAPIEMAKESARRSIQAAMGQTPLPTAAQRRNEKSGVALERIEQLGQRGSFHFVDHYLDMITQVGIIGEDLMDKVYDSARTVGIRKANDTSLSVRINDPNDPEAIDTHGDHLVTVSTGPSFDSEREQASEFADTLIASPAMQIVGPMKAPQILARAVKLKNLGTIGDEIAEIIDPSLNPEGEGAPNAQQAAQLAQENQELKGVLQQMQQALQSQVVEQQAKQQTAQMQEDAENRRAVLKIQSEERARALDNLVKLAVAEIQASSQQAKTDAEQARTELGFAHETALDTAHAGHEEHMAALGAQHAERQAAQAAAAETEA